MVAFNKQGQGYFTFEEFVEETVIHMHFKDYKSETVKNVMQRSLYFVLKKHHTYSKYSFDDIIRIDFDKEYFVFKVYYSSGDWFHYTTSGEWY